MQTTVYYQPSSLNTNQLKIFLNWEWNPNLQLTGWYTTWLLTVFPTLFHSPLLLSYSFTQPYLPNLSDHTCTVSSHLKVLHSWLPPPTGKKTLLWFLGLKGSLPMSPILSTYFASFAELIIIWDQLKKRSNLPLRSLGTENQSWYPSPWPTMSLPITTHTQVTEEDCRESKSEF